MDKKNGWNSKNERQQGLGTKNGLQRYFLLSTKVLFPPIITFII